MDIYIDCVSGVDHLVSMSNKRYNFLKEDSSPTSEEQYTDKDPEMHLLSKLASCYFDGAISSQCGRRIIHLYTLVSNLNKAIAEDKTKLQPYYYNKIVKAAFAGISDNCASSDQSDSYKPAKKAKK